MAKVQLRALRAGQQIDLTKGHLEGWRFLRNGEMFPPGALVVEQSSRELPVGKLVALISSAAGTHYTGGFKPTGKYESGPYMVLVPREATAKYHLERGEFVEGWKATPPPFAKVKDPFTNKVVWTDLRKGTWKPTDVASMGDISVFADNAEWVAAPGNLGVQGGWSVKMPLERWPTSIRTFVAHESPLAQPPPSLISMPQAGPPQHTLYHGHQYTIPSYIDSGYHEVLRQQAATYGLYALPEGTVAEADDYVAILDKVGLEPTPAVTPGGAAVVARRNIFQHPRVILRPLSALTPAQAHTLGIIVPTPVPTGRAVESTEGKALKMARKGVKGALKDSTKGAIRAGGAAASRKIATAGMKSAIAALKGSMGDKWPAFFDTDAGKVVLEMGAPFLFSTIADAYAGESPMMAMLASGFASARDAAAADIVEKGAEFIIPLMEKFAETGGMLAAGGGPKKAIGMGRDIFESQILEEEEPSKERK